MALLLQAPLPADVQGRDQVTFWRCGKQMRCQLGCQREPQRNKIDLFNVRTFNNKKKKNHSKSI